MLLAWIWTMWFWMFLAILFMDCSILACIGFLVSSFNILSCIRWALFQFKQTTWFSQCTQQFSQCWWPFNVLYTRYFYGTYFFPSSSFIISQSNLTFAIFREEPKQYHRILGPLLPCRPHLFFVVALRLWPAVSLISRCSTTVHTLNLPSRWSSTSLRLE